MNETRRLFISTNVKSIDGLLKEKRTDSTIISKFLGFGNCWPKDEDDEDLPNIQNEIASFQSNENGFVEDCKDSTTLFLVHDKLASLPDGITINKEADYLISHGGATDTDGTKQDIINLFEETHVKSSHHQQNEPLDEAFKIIINDEIADKSEAIIKKVFDDTNIRTEGLKLLTSYLKEKPKGECPTVFKRMKTAYDALRNCTDNVKGDEYTQCLIQLRDEFVKHYYSI